MKLSENARWPLLKTVKRRCRNLLWGLSLLGCVYFGLLLSFTIKHISSADTIEDRSGEHDKSGQYAQSSIIVSESRLRRQVSDVDIASSTFAPDTNVSVPFSTTSLTEVPTKPQGIYPTDIFDLKARKKGAVVLHVIGMLYMFVALAIVCDEFFVPTLEVIIHRLSISDDVAGATFMAAGGSAPELFTSIIGVFLAKSNVGIGTIVGSAVFNILFVIGMCSLFSLQLLRLTWWPLFRDCFFYILSLLLLIYAFYDATIQIHESILLILVYLCYVSFMKFNRPIESWVKLKLSSLKSSSTSQAAKVGPSEDPKETSKSVKAMVDSMSGQPHSRSTFSYGIVQLMMHSLDPATEDTMSEKSSRMYAIARMKMINPSTARSLSTRNPDRPTHPRYEQRSKSDATVATVVYENEGVKVIPDSFPKLAESVATPVEDTTIFNQNSLTTIDEGSEHTRPANGYTFSSLSENGQNQKKNKAQNGDAASQNEHNEDTDDDGDDALDMSWPSTVSKRCVYVLIFPITFLLWITLPDVRKANKKKWFMGSFFGSIIWIALFSYVMVWMAHQIGDTIGLSEAVMGLTFLAAGTSVPDLITSVIVARKGLGDMAVSSSVGSNIFDVTIGLPFPWLLASIIELGAPIDVASEGLFCSVILLFAMLLFVVISIAVCRWKMSKKLGVTMLILYVVFLVFSLLLELSVIDCILVPK
ncbi:sodium/potassium/calcium exchanger 2-like isoform X2 [Clavelina lepadiformis]|uniref:sodium/potassium/calcium exchanger 2-like isoform X2 n=1 Tax=Clavelina lepadiformis TaxID=159417 RepID=UPI0040430379